MCDSDPNINAVAEQLKEAVLTTMNANVENSLRAQAFSLLEQVSYLIICC